LGGGKRVGCWIDKGEGGARSEEELFIGTGMWGIDRIGRRWRGGGVGRVRVCVGEMMGVGGGI